MTLENIMGKLRSPPQSLFSVRLEEVVLDDRPMLVEDDRKSLPAGRSISVWKCASRDPFEEMFSKKYQK